MKADDPTMCFECNIKPMVTDNYCETCYEEISSNRSIKSHVIQFIGIENDDNIRKAVFKYISGPFSELKIALSKGALKIRIRIRRDHGLASKVELMGLMRLK